MVSIGLIASVYACGSATDSSRGANKLEKLAVGDMARLDFGSKGSAASNAVFLAPSGQDISMADFDGKVVVLNIWATWCAPCEKEMPSLAALQTARGSDKMEVVAISIDELSEREDVARKLQKLTGGVLNFYQSKDLAITSAFGVSIFPTTIIYDAQGIEVARLAGDADWAGYEAIAVVDEVLRQSGG